MFIALFLQQVEINIFYKTLNAFEMILMIKG